MTRKNATMGLVALACALFALWALLGPLSDDGASSGGASTEAIAPTAAAREGELLRALAEREREVEALRVEVTQLEGLLAANREAVQSAATENAVEKSSPQGDAVPGDMVGGLDSAVHLLKAVLPEQFGEMSADEIASLTSIDLDGTKISDADLACLASLTALETLGLEGTAVTDAGLAHLWSLPRLSSLDLRSTQVTGAGLWNIPAHQLEALHLTDTRVSADDLRSLPAMPRLQMLKLNGLGVGDDDVLDLAHLASLRHLELDRTPITGDGVRTLLAQNPALRRVELRSTGVTKEALNALRQEYPGVEFVWEDSSMAAIFGR